MENWTAIPSHLKLAAALGLNDTSCPDQNAWLWKMFEATKDTAQKTLDWAFVKSIVSGTMDSDAYSKFTVLFLESKVYFNKRNQSTYEGASKRELEKDMDADMLRYFNLRKTEANNAMAESMVQWKEDKEGSSNTSLMQKMEEYADYELEIATNYPSYYSLVLALPKAFLFPWMTDHISKTGANMGDQNPFFQKKNQKTMASCFLMANFIEKHTNKMNFDKACEVFRTAMQMEIDVLQAMHTASGGSAASSLASQQWPGMKDRWGFQAPAASQYNRMDMYNERMQALIMKQEALMVKQEIQMLRQEARMAETTMKPQMMKQETQMFPQEMMAQMMAGLTM